jgi:ribosomal protein S27E
MKKDPKKALTCPKCEGTEAVYNYGKKKILCEDCGTPLSEFKPRE